MNLQMLGFDGPLLIRQMLDLSEEMEDGGSAQLGDYVDGDARAAAPTSADVTEYRNSYAFVVDVPGLKSGEIEVKVEGGRVLAISGQRKREEATEGANYARMERSVGTFVRKFSLPEDANTDAVSAACQDGVLTVTVEKMSPPEPKTAEVKTA